ncbi:hypothetical protein E0L36_26765 [Streptomyces sp. AJS327]|uniref:hypothetical protein n=1 Tax=Streptomyces sp. AJS327 TaxID=2545265 RepID=UPI0015DE0160|nr:hypothetical protein [Streptomyces sp. AJS327]MBA0054322.1 hypothetical protein [Streptomyces sp. AJS327]
MSSRNSKTRVYTWAVEQKRRAQELVSGPRYSYSIARWSEKRESAEKALNSLRFLHSTVRVVEAQGYTCEIRNRADVLTKYAKTNG